MKKIILIAFAMCLTGVFSSCGNKNDKAIDEFEKVVKKMEKTDDLTKLQILAEQGETVLNDLNEKIDPKSLTKEQEERLAELGADYVKACSKLIGGAMESVKDMNDAIKSMNKQFEEINEQFEDEDDESLSDNEY